MSSFDVLESQIEKAVVRYARSDHWGLGIKFKDPSRRHAPDRIFLFPRGKVCFIEFKAPGKVPNEGQVEYARTLINLGFPVLFCDSIESGKKFLRNVLGT
jgi:hypothetical protein